MVEKLQKLQNDPLPCNKAQKSIWKQKTQNQGDQSCRIGITKIAKRVDIAVQCGHPVGVSGSSLTYFDHRTWKLTPYIVQ